MWQECSPLVGPPPTNYMLIKADSLTGPAGAPWPATSGTWLCTVHFQGNAQVSQQQQLVQSEPEHPSC